MSGHLQPDLEHDAYAGKGDKPVQTTTNESTEVGVIDPLHDVARVTDHKAERALARKFDFRLLPVLALMCMSPWSPGQWMILMAP